MTEPRARARAAVTSVLGLVLAATYVAVVLVAGRHDLLVRRPVLDGFGPPPAYRYVNPPPALRASNKAPASGRFSIDLAPASGSVAKVVNTSDIQVSVALADGAIPTAGSADSVTIAITPFAPSHFPAAPNGESIVGNVYRIEATYRPSGQAIVRTRTPVQVVLFYPKPLSAFGFSHTMLRSSGTGAWSALRSIDSPAQQMVQATTSTFGVFAVGERQTSAARKPGLPIGRILTWTVFGALALLVVGGIVRSEVRHRRELRSSGRRGNGRARERPSRDAKKRARERRRPPRPLDDDW